jgi:hypothetical protein
MNTQKAQQERPGLIGKQLLIDRIKEVEASNASVIEALRGLLTYCEANNMQFAPGWGESVKARALDALETYEKNC